MSSVDMATQGMAPPDGPAAGVGVDSAQGHEPERPVGAQPTAESLGAAIQQLLEGVDHDNTPIYKFRRKVAQHLGLGKKGLEHKASEVNELVKVALAKKQSEATESSAEWIAKVVTELGEEDTSAKLLVYLVTISRVLPATLAATDLRDISDMSRSEVRDAVVQAFDEPLASTSGGRPRTRTESIVKKIVVFMENHADGTTHFHVAVLLLQPRGWTLAKRTLRERDHLPSHWSCTHTQWYTALGYGAIPTLKKPYVDENPDKFPMELELFEESQRPWNAAMWKRRREQAATQSAAGLSKRRRFSKLDLTSLVLAKDLKTKAALLEYAQDYGTEDMQHFLHNHQKQLKEFLNDAAEWGEARAVAAADRETDWALVCRTAEGVCVHGDACTYAQTATRFFEANSGSFSQTELAIALRGITVNGPSKTTRVPLIIGPTNTGKSTLVLPLDQIFGFARVFHKPALGSAFALRNILKDKRFLFWDDIRPVEFAQQTLPVTTFLSLFQGQPFEVQVSQSFNDGNVDFEWSRGAVMTAKAKGLWTAYGEVDEEDIRHMKSRVLVFDCTATLSKLKDTIPCATCMCSWICGACSAHDAAQVLAAPVLPVAVDVATNREEGDRSELIGMTALAAKAHLSAPKAKVLETEILSLGAIHVQELVGSDWTNLSSWAALQPFEQRRFLACLSL